MSVLAKITYLDDLKQLWNFLPNARLVGGVVRDLLADKSIADIDLATPEPPEKVMEILKKVGISVIPTGLSHGTVTAVIKHRPYEITTLRKDVMTYGRHAQVIWTDNWREDAARRDFTINAMSCDKEGHIWDFYHGQEDLKSGTIRFVGNAEKRIEEDVLRILRFFRFYARYGKGMPDDQAVAAIQSLAVLLPNLSAERVWSELRKIITGPKADQMIKMMDQYGVLPQLLPFGYNLASFYKLILLNGPKHEILRLAALVTAESGIVAKKLRLSRKESSLLKALQKPLNIKPVDIEDHLRQLRALYDIDLLLNYSWIKQLNNDDYTSIQWNQWRDKITEIQRPLFPIKGKDLIQLGVKPGIEMGDALSQIKIWWLHNGCHANLQECLQWFNSNK